MPLNPLASVHGTCHCADYQTLYRQVSIPCVTMHYPSAQIQGATVAVMAGTAGAASLGIAEEQEPVKPKSPKRKPEMQ